jgi:triacylglycerol lipase
MTTFDQKFARLLLEICRYTYAASFNSAANAGDKKDALNWIDKAGARDSLVMLNDDKHPSTSVACVVAYPDKNIVSYMGTKTEFNTLDEAIESISDWAQNIEALLVPFKLTTEQLGLNHPDKNSLGGRVHNGFLEELSAVQAKVVQELMRHGGKNRPVYVTGHSQGGAEAALATRALLAGGFPVVATYTFAAPRPGDQAFADSIPATLPLHRLEFGDDIVPHVPPAMISKNVRAIVAGLLKIPLLPEHVKKLLNFLEHTTEETSFAGVGRLCYGNHETKALRVDISAQQEAALFNSRLMGLVSNPKHWADHHHLAGTTAEVSSGVKGNYTALVSEFPMVS